MPGPCRPPTGGPDPSRDKPDDGRYDPSLWRDLDAGEGRELDRRRAEILRHLPLTDVRWTLYLIRLQAYVAPLVDRALAGKEVPGRLRSIATYLGLTGDERDELSRNALDRAALVSDIVHEGIKLFHRNVTGQVWSHRGGASLASYFVTGCHLASRNAARRWRAGRSKDALVGEEEFTWLHESAADSRHRRQQADAEATEHAQDRLDRLGDDPRYLDAAELRESHGSSWDTAARMAGLTPREMHAWLRRQRRRDRLDHADPDRPHDLEENL